MPKKLTIVGGGISGLATAYYLEKLTDYEICLYESGAEFGGKVKTIKEDGYILEFGPDSFITTKPYALQLSKELGLKSELIKPASQGFSIYYQNKLHKVPDGLASMVPENFLDFFKSSLFSLKGKIRFMAEPFISPHDDKNDISLAEFMTSRLGIEMSERLAGPLLSGIYCADAEKLSLKASFPHFIDMVKNHGSITAAVNKRRKMMKGKEMPAVFMSFKNGIQTLTDALHQKLKRTKLQNNTAVQQVNPQGDAYALSLSNGQKEMTDILILNTPAHVNQQLTATLDSGLSQAFSAIPYVSTTVVNLAFPESAFNSKLKGTGFICAKKHTQSISSCTWSSKKWDGRAPDGKLLLRCYFVNHGNGQQSEYTDKELLDMAHNSLNDIIGLNSKAEKHWIHRWNQAMPQYYTGHLEILSEIDQKLSKHKGIYISGAAYKGIGLPDCIKQAKETAEEIAKEV